MALKVGELHAYFIQENSLPNCFQDLSRECTEVMRPLSGEVIEACHNALKSNRLKEVTIANFSS